MFENPTSPPSSITAHTKGATLKERAPDRLLSEAELWDSAVGAFERLAKLEEVHEISERQLALKALEACYALYFQFAANIPAWEALLIRRGLPISKQTRNPSSPLVGHFLGLTHGANDRAKQSSWSTALEYAFEMAIEPDDFLKRIAEFGGVDKTAKLRREAKKTKEERLAELEQAKAEEDAFFVDNAPVRLEATGLLENLDTGYHTIIVRRSDDGNVDVLTRVDESSSSSQKRLRKVIQTQDAPIAPKAKPKHRHTHLGGSRPIKLANDHTAIVNAETAHPHLRRAPSENENILKGGENSRKLGSVVNVGKWNGFPIFSLTLEERATCPNTCEVWNNCYGNGMSQQRAWRYKHGGELQRHLERELRILSLDAATSNGFVVRIHTLGDFYSVEYVEWWMEQFVINPPLHAWCYTAHEKDPPIGIALQKVVREFPGRFSLRWSNAGAVKDGTVVVDPKVVDLSTISARICPAQTGAKADCGSCAFCWESNAPIVFLEH